MNRRTAFLRQARSDFAVFEHLARQERALVSECHPLHYFQMATEKLAKAALDAAGALTDPYSHVAFSKMPYRLARADVARVLGFNNTRAYRGFLARTAPLFRAIDELSPAVGPRHPGGGPQEGPNVEYPWASRDSRGHATWIVPAEHDFRLLTKLQRSGEGAQVRDFVRVLLERFEIVFTG